MKTPSHMLIGYMLARVWPGTDPRLWRWAAVGAGAPDLPLILVGGIASGLSWGTGLDFRTLMDSLYFGNPLFIGLHHLLHAPLCLLMLVLGWGVTCRFTGKTDLRGDWFLAGAASHALIDLLTHSRDGVFPFWPFSQSKRLDAGLDQWDMGGAGGWLLIGEGAILLGGACFALYFAWQRFTAFQRHLARADFFDIHQGFHRSSLREPPRRKRDPAA